MLMYRVFNLELFGVDLMGLLKSSIEVFGGCKCRVVYGDVDWKLKKEVRG